MKTNYYSLFAAAALLGLASCSSDEPNNGSNNGGLADGENYMAFTISNVGGNSRAAGAIAVNTEEAKGNYEGAVSAENVRFFFYDANGNAFNFDNSVNVNGAGETSPYDENMITPTAIEGADGKLTGVLVLGKAVGTGYIGAVPSKVLCVANATPTVITDIKGKNLATAKAATITTGINANAAFMMTSATWVRNDKTANAEVMIEDDNIEGYVYKTPTDATANPITINIERLAAKVRATYTANIAVDNTKDDTKLFVVDGKKVQFKINIDGWRLFNTNNSSNVFKQLNPTYTWTPEWVWNWESDKRSFWANSLASATFTESERYDIYTASQFANKSYVAETPTQNIAYCYENTNTYTPAEGVTVTNPVTYRPNNKNTAVVVVGSLDMYDEAGTTLTKENVDFCKWFGNYYTSDALKGMIVDAYNSKNGVKVTKDDVVFEKNSTEDNSYSAKIKGAVQTNFDNILWWQNGVTSYYLNIEHQGGVLGVVRNHIYDYTFDGVKGLGFPGNDDKTPEEEETFVAAKLNILNWNVISNHITLE